MKSSKLPVEEVVNKIKAAMSSKAGSSSLQSSSINPAGENIALSADLKKDLNLELYNNNLRWNIVTELPITSHRKIIGPFLVIGRKLVVKYLRWYINPPHDQQRSFNGSVTRSINLLRALTEVQDARIAKLDEKQGKIAPMIEDNTRLMKELHAEIAKTNELLKTIESERLLIADRMRRIEGRLASSTAIPDTYPMADTSGSCVTQDKPESLDLDYFSFEQKFRGDRTDIKNRQRIFIDLFREKGEILDIGCGRGEFVELLTENGITATGIDIDDDMVSYCVDHGLPVLKKDAFEHLEARGDGSLGGIFMSQVIEHLQPKEIIRFIRLAHTKLKPGGVLLIETIDPSNIVAMATWFQMDLSHNRPLHPATAQFLFESAGFGEIKFFHSNPDKDHEIPMLQLDGVDGNLAAFNQSIEHVNKVLYGPQDYAIVGTKLGGIAP